MGAGLHRRRLRPWHPCGGGRRRRGAYQTLDTTGIAPKANLFDVKVLDDNGFGQLSDVLAGIDWVLYHAKEYNIRVMNLSLAADSTETLADRPAGARRAQRDRSRHHGGGGRRQLRPDRHRRASATAPSARPATTRR